MGAASRRRCRSGVRCAGEPRAFTLEIAAGVAFLVLLVLWFTLDGQDDLLYHGGFLLAEIAVLVLLMTAVHPENWVFGRAMAFAPSSGWTHQLRRVPLSRADLSGPERRPRWASTAGP